MTVTLFGILVLMIGTVVLVRGSTLSMLVFVMMTTLMGGSAAFILSTGSSILPSIEAVLLLAIRCIMPTQRPAGVLRSAIGDNLPLVLFMAYGVAGAFVLPFIFAGAIDVAPLRPIFTPNPFATAPLAFSSQNLTTAGYLITTTIGAICAFIAVQAPGAGTRIARVAAIVGVVHATLGFVSIAVAGTPAAVVIDVFRNASYNQVEQEVAGLSRMNGIFAEASNFAGYGFIYFVFVCELWLRNIDHRWTGLAALMLLSALFVSTSSTGYLGLASYAALLALRKILFPGTVGGTKLLAMMIGVLVVAAATIGALVLRPDYLEFVDLVYRMMIVNKSESESGLVRMMWARQGIEAFWVSGGLGVGVGSFRSSSLGSAILGSMGVIGIATYAAQMLRVLKPLRHSTFVKTGDVRLDVGAAASWTVMAMTVPAFVSVPSPDPGLNWGLMVGIALGLRYRTAFGLTTAPSLEAAEQRPYSSRSQQNIMS